MSEDKLKDLKSKFNKKETPTSRENNKLKLAIERYVSLGETIQSWKKIAYLFVGLFLISSAMCTYLYTQKNIYPFIMKVDEKSGEILESKVLLSKKIKIGEKETEYFLKKFIIDTRTIMLDKKYFDEKLNAINNFLTPTTATKISEILSREKLNEIFEQEITRNVEIISISRLPENNESFQVRWREKTFNAKGVLTKRRNYVSILKIDYFTPNMKQIEHNPLGIIIKDFNMIEEN